MSVTVIEKALKQIFDQQYLLKIIEVYDVDLELIFENYRQTFYLVKKILEEDFNEDYFWPAFDVANKLLVGCIEDWIDMKYYNFYRFKPYSLYDKVEVECAVLKSEQSNK